MEHEDTRSGVDVSLTGLGSVWLFLLRSAAAREWWAEHVDSPEWSKLGDGRAVEHRFVADIVDGMRDDGLMVA